MVFSRLESLDYDNDKGFIDFTLKDEKVSVKCENKTCTIELFDKVLEIHPEHVMANYEKAMALFNIEKFEDAIVSLNVVLEVDPNAFLAWYTRGIAKIQLGRNDFCTDLYKAYELGFTDAQEVINDYCE